MNGYDAKRQREEILERLRNEQQMAQYRQNQQRANVSPLDIINKANGLSKGVYNAGSKLQKAGNFLQTRSNPVLNNIGGEIGKFGSNLQNLSLRPQISGMLAGKAAPVASTLGNTLGTGTSALGGTTAGTGSALTSAISSAAPSATSIAGGAGAAGLAGAASAALPVVGAALMAGQFIKGQLDKAQQKANAKAMQADANAINATENRVNQQKQGVMNDLMQQSQQDAQEMTQPQSTLTQEIMSQAYPDYTQSETGVPTGFASNVDNNVEFEPLPPIQVAEGEDGSAVIPQVEDTKESIMDKIRGGLTNFKAGYDDNSLHGFSEGDMHNNLIAGNSQPVVPQDGVLTGGAAQTKKTIMNRLGEAVGTGRRLMANPWTQALIAGGVSKAAGGDIDDIAKAAYDYGTAKAKSDQYYKAINPDAKVMPVFNTFDANDYKAKAYNDFNQGRSMISRRDLFKLNNPTMSDEDVDKMLLQTGINGDEMISLKGYDSVQKANYNNGRLTQGQQKINNQKEYQQGQLKVSQGRAAETARHNRVSEGQRGQSIANSKANSNRNYKFKVNQAEQKKIEAELKRRGLI